MIGFAIVAATVFSYAVAWIIGIPLLCAGLVGIGLGVLRYATADDLAKAIGQGAKVHGIDDPELRQEALSAKMKQEGLLLLAGGIGLSFLGVLLARKPRRTRRTGGQTPAHRKREASPSARWLAD